jgi:ribonucleotide monophosphatase NagD (HAD superfamily)
MFYRVYQRKISYIPYGKPHLTTMKYCKNYIDTVAARAGLVISSYYMIGDNPSGDIRGANNMGWTSILVKSGVFSPKNGQNGQNDQTDPANFVVDNFHQAVKLILQKRTNFIISVFWIFF